MFRTKRKVRYFLKNDGGTVEGIEAGRTRSDYIVWCPKILEGEADAPVELSDHVEIERANVLFRQIIG